MIFESLFEGFRLAQFLSTRYFVGRSSYRSQARLAANSSINIDICFIQLSAVSNSSSNIRNALRQQLAAQRIKSHGTQNTYPVFLEVQNPSANINLGHEKFSFLESRSLR